MRGLHLPIVVGGLARHYGRLEDGRDGDGAIEETLAPRRQRVGHFDTLMIGPAVLGVCRS